ncbi:EpsG family protein [Enterobacter mori]|uniref:EpsG family protein n=1 Tax=Enterobacter mori TaxID=539813 RepID=A0A7T0GZG0_9ENTR|nr:EpsG family protein [Enterobacter mori]QPJ99035.1 EpsG family protein [Enterobacter mori]
MIEKNAENKYNKNLIGFIYLFFIATLLLGIFLANSQFLGVSRDYDNYIQIFSGKESGGVLELFYRGLMLITTNYLIVIFIILICSFFIKAKFLAKYSRNFSGLTLFLIYYACVALWVLDYTQFRNGLCISILMFSVYYLHKRNPVYFYFSVFCAIATHWSAIPFLLLYPFLYSQKIRFFGYLCICALVLVAVSGYANEFIYFIRTYGIGQKIGNDAGVNIINSLSLTAIVWFAISYLSVEKSERQFFRLFFSYGVMQYIIFCLFSLPVMAFRILEMYFFLMLAIGIFIREERGYYFTLIKLLIILYLTYYYHVVFGVINV